MLCFMPIGDWQQLCGLQRKTHGIYMPPYAYCYIWSWNGSQRLRQPTQGQNEHEELVPISVDSPSDAALCFVFLLTQTREKEHTWVTTFAESEGERISNHCSVRCILRPIHTDKQRLEKLAKHTRNRTTETSEILAFLQSTCWHSLITKRLTPLWFAYLFSFDSTVELISNDWSVKLNRRLKSSGQSLSRDNRSRWS